MTQKKRRPDWIPFSGAELAVGLSILGLLATLSSGAGNSAQMTMGLTLGAAGFFYLSGLCVHGFSRRSTLHLIVDGGLQGRGYIGSFLRAREALFLIHVEDDSPCQELLAAYRQLLGRGVKIRRTVFIRDDSDASAYRWIEEFGEHPGLQQRIVRGAEAEMMRLSFAVVDQQEALLAVPGFGPADDESYSPGLQLRHLLVIEQPEAVSAFLRLHEQLWQRAVPLDDESLGFAAREKA